MGASIAICVVASLCELLDLFADPDADIRESMRSFWNRALEA
jgi:hypothetical protein